mgnify:FL=1
MQKEFSEEERATMSSLNSLFASVGFAIASFLLGFYADIVGPTKALLTATILGIPVIFIYLRLFKEEVAS